MGYLTCYSELTLFPVPYLILGAEVENVDDTNISDLSWLQMFETFLAPIPQQMCCVLTEICFRGCQNVYIDIIKCEVDIVRRL